PISPRRTASCSGHCSTAASFCSIIKRFCEASLNGITTMWNDHLSRRDWMKLAAVGGLSVPASGWLSTLAARAAELPTAAQKNHKHCILLFMTGGASHVDTFDPKPENATSQFKPISTTVSGIQVCE